jgi:hypothetical protein
MTKILSEDDMVTKYETVDGDNDLGLAILELKEGPYVGTKFSFGKVRFGDPDDEQIVVSFDYDVHEARGLEAPTPEFEKVIGDILVDLLEDYARMVKEKESECSE